MDDERLKAWICTKCGAPLPEPTDEAAAVRCASCGTMFRAGKMTPNSGAEK